MSDYGIKTYADLAETCGGMVLANEMAYRPMELMSGNWAPWEEIFQWYIVQDPSVSEYRKIRIMSRENIKVDLVIREASLACPEVVGSEPVPVIKNSQLGGHVAPSFSSCAPHGF